MSHRKLGKPGAVLPRSPSQGNHPVKRSTLRYSLPLVWIAMPAGKPSSQPSSNHAGSDHSHSKSRTKTSRPRRHSHGKLTPHDHSDASNLKIPKHAIFTADDSEGHELKDDQGRGLYRLDEGSQIWRTFDGTVIYWEVHQLTYKELSEAIWNWAERGLEPTQKLYIASLRPPHGGHRSGLLDFFCSHRQKLVRDHIQRIYSDLYLILRTWTELKDYLEQLNDKNAVQESSQTLKKIENRLTFHLMVALREYCGLPLDPKHPDKPSWPVSSGLDEKQETIRLKSAALISSTKDNSGSADSSSNISENSKTSRGRSTPRRQDSETKALCCHCHQILDEDKKTDREVIQSKDNANLLSLPRPYKSPSSSSTHDHEKSESSRTHSDTSRSSSRNNKSDTERRSHSRSRKENQRTRSKSKTRKESEHKSREHKSPDQAQVHKGKHSGSGPSTQGLQQPHTSKVTRTRRHSNDHNVKGKKKSHDDDHESSDDSSLISFDSTQFSNTLGMIFHHCSMNEEHK
ncbi:hypothetical protein MJO28_002558 [Puccinia striiformis f. sp. tritici]|uniref:Uncharacterized protein n=1 Tax=Puccinia striiformis f. sp. tritici TaxID=168172 RepID=A0ACC0EQ56_9BASI|nr:hypothetical protein MJO28_002558 [Puccinia striiformis f. sp. tritici]